MSEIPKLELNQWVTVNNTDCVIRRFLTENPEIVCEVVYLHLNKLTTNFVSWNGSGFFFNNPFNDFGGYAIESEPCVVKLREGRRYGAMAHNKSFKPTPLSVGVLFSRLCSAA